MVKRKLLAKLMTLIESYLICDKKTSTNTNVGVPETHKKFKKPEKKQKVMNHPRINNADRLQRMRNNEKLKIDRARQELDDVAREFCRRIDGGNASETIIEELTEKYMFIERKIQFSERRVQFLTMFISAADEPTALYLLPQ